MGFPFATRPPGGFGSESLYLLHCHYPKLRGQVGWSFVCLWLGVPSLLLASLSCSPLSAAPFPLIWFFTIAVATFDER